jgi:hypothetical protein
MKSGILVRIFVVFWMSFEGAEVSDEIVVNRGIQK